jgi:MFS family permease
MGSIAFAAGLLALATFEADGRIDGLRRPKDRATAGLGLVPLIGGGMVFIAFLTENAAENWSALHIEKTLGGSPAHGAMGPAVIALTMGVARLFGQGLAHKVRPQTLLTVGAALSAAGALVAAYAGSPMMAYAGFFVMGIGASVIAPTAFSLVGLYAEPQARARAIARATLLGYFGYFFGPPLLGFVAGHLGLRMAFVFAAVTLLAIPFLARQMARQQP